MTTSSAGSICIRPGYFWPVAQARSSFSTVCDEGWSAGASMHSCIIVYRVLSCIISMVSVVALLVLTSLAHGSWAASEYANCGGSGAELLSQRFCLCPTVLSDERWVLLHLLTFATAHFCRTYGWSCRRPAQWMWTQRC